MSFTATFRRLLLLLPLLAAAASPAQADPAIGFQHLNMPDGVEIGIWYPANASAAAPRQIELYAQLAVENAPVAGRGHPLVVMSHGTGGSYAGHIDTAVALARAGFVAAALTHPGDNWRDQSRVLQLDGRPAALSALISYMLGTWTGRETIDPRRVGAFGFSAGGFTVLAAAGGRPDLSLVAPHCQAHPDFFDCGLVAAHGGNVPPNVAAHWQADTRIRAVVAAAPALGFAFGRAGLAEVRVPVQLWKAGGRPDPPGAFLCRGGARRAARRA